LTKLFAGTVTVEGIKLAERPDAETATVMETSPEKPSVLWSVISGELEDCAIKLTVSAADMEKSTTLTGIVTERVNEPEFPVTVTVNEVATGELTVRVVVCDPPAVRITLYAVSVTELPESVVWGDKLIVPLKPLMLDRVMIDMFVEPSGMISEEGLAEI